MNWLMLIEIASGYCFFVRTLDTFVCNSRFSTASLTKFGTIYAVWVVIGVKKLSLTPLLLVFWLVTPTVMSLSIKALRRFWWQNNYEKEILLFLNNTILQMRGGYSLRDSIRASIYRTSANFRKNLEQIEEVVSFSPHISLNKRNKLEKELLSELILADQETHSGLQRLKNLRRKLEIEAEFRHRSGQILTQIRLQATVLSILYVLLLAFSLRENAMDELFGIMILSFSFFAVGLVWVVSAGRRLRWKV